MKKVSILYICTGEYRNFFPDFKKSCDKFFLPGMEKEYFVFSDKKHEYFNYENVNYIKIDKSPWPLNTLLRFHYFSLVEDKLKENDYAYFFNANALFLSEFSDDLLPKKEYSYLTAIPHPGLLKKCFLLLPWERRKKLECYIPYTYKGTYCQGGFNGGKTSAYLKLINWCKEAITTDLKNNLIAVWHDESYINRYFLDNKPEILSKDYIWPEAYPDNPDAVIIMRDKNKCEWYKGIK